MTANVGLEHSFLASWQGWDIVGGSGDLCFYKCKLANHLQGLEPEGTDDIMMTLLMSESTIQFDFFKLGEHLSSRAFKIKAVIEEEIPCEN